MQRLLSFPNPVNEKAARVVAAGVATLAILVLATGWQWLIAVMATGFLARVLTGPRLSPLGQLATRVVAPRLGPPKLVPGPPKRFAQSIGLAFTATAAVAALAFGAGLLATVLMSVLLVFALLESVVGFCAGCFVFGWLMRLGLVPEETCEACNDISLRYRETVRAGATTSV
ncbi:MAG TPA: DUF4395 domain-containing protein [Dermatophilaceae bacterium]|jgi:hypothetical protein|nr:DUF4395 domain-containing protein [Dermatophilaceae bacterium]